MDRYLRLIVPAQNPLDRAEMYADMRAAAPPEVFDQLLDVAVETLDATLAARLRSDLQLAGRRPNASAAPNHPPASPNPVGKVDPGQFS